MQYKNNPVLRINLGYLLVQRSSLIHSLPALVFPNVNMATFPNPRYVLSASPSKSVLSPSDTYAPAEISRASTEDSQLRGLEGLPVHHFSSVKDLQERVKSLSIKLQTDSSNQYLIF
jgi:hypothetical protein